VIGTWDIITVVFAWVGLSVGATALVWAALRMAGIAEESDPRPDPNGEKDVRRQGGDN